MSYRSKIMVAAVLAMILVGKSLVALTIVLVMARSPPRASC